MKRWIILIVVAVSSGLAASPVSGQSQEALKTELERLKADVENLKSEMRLIREVIIQRMAQPTVPAAPTPAPRGSAVVNVMSNPALGKSDAPVILVEFSDYQCPFCRRFFETTLPALKSEYIDTGKLKYVFRDFPLDSIHPHARKAAETAHCADDQGKYWPMHDTLFQNQAALQVDRLKTYAERLHLNAEMFSECLDSGKYANKVQRSVDEGARAGVQGTPAFFIGRTRPDGTVEGALLSGARPLEEFRQQIERALVAK